ncbi:T9SS type A sorting domain-containing protein [Chryseobacterium sp. JUb7]|uniref:T9SS type A sorting domain-containing protein n=1 Tax=Chryseobacterium sp. JUb7 TaxID=2940599 RepID=UPI00216714F9|nr:T9SS type A sorting domain-containing protein [Chryseobacterium sp. JUb7]MCS3531439.1 ELWxxDGT repeat protein [Chryseobacterium sp. JUb7]
MNKKLFSAAFVALLSLHSIKAQINLIKKFSDVQVPSAFSVHKGKLYFMGREENTSNTEMWVYDSSLSVSATNPKLLVDLDNDPATGTSPKNFTTYNGKLFFSNNLNTYSYDDTLPISATNPRIIGPRGNSLRVFDNKLFYEEAVNSPISIWTFDDNLPVSATNPKRLVEPNVNAIMTNFGFVSAVFNDKLYFNGRTTNNNNSELYVYNPAVATSATNPSRVYDINPGNNGSFPGGFITYQNKLYFTANDGTGEELWMYNGINNPSKVYDFDTSPYGGLAYYKTLYNDQMYFAAHNNTVGTELWRYNGVNTPQLVADIYPGTEYSIPRNLTVFNNKLVFDATNGVNGREIWVYDSTLATSSSNPRLIDIFPGSGNGFDTASTFVVYNDILYFGARTSSSNAGLFSIQASYLSTSETESVSKADIKIYQNPSSEEVTVESAENLQEIQVLSAIGQNIMKLAPNSKKETVSLSNKGLYYFVIKTAKNNKIVKKIMVK